MKNKKEKIELSCFIIIIIIISFVFEASVYEFLAIK